MLKKLSPRHEDIIRHLVCGTTPREICIMYGVTNAWLSTLQSDPLFHNRLKSVMNAVHGRFIEHHATAMDRLREASLEAAGFVVDTMKDEQAPLNTRLKSAWDILDRTGVRDATKQDVVFNVSNLVIQAYSKRKNISVLNTDHVVQIVDEKKGGV